MCNMSDPRIESDSSIDLDREPPRRKRNRNLLIAGVVVAVVSVVVLGLYLNRDEPAGRAESGPELVDDPPPTGRYAIRAAHSKLCLGLGPEIKDGEVNEDKEVFVQQDCDKRFPPTGLRSQGNGLYRMTVHHPEIGSGCGRVDGSDEDGPGEYLVTPQTCADDDRQFYLLERDEDTYLIRMSTDADQCLGILEGSRKPGAQVVTGPCGKPAQKWYVEKP